MVFLHYRQPSTSQEILRLADIKAQTHYVYYILNETEKSIEYYRKAQELCDSHDEFVRLYQIDKKDLIKQGANEVDLFILPDELI